MPIFHKVPAIVRPGRTVPFGESPIPDIRSPGRGNALIVFLAISGLSACAGLGGLARRTADSPSSPWTPPAKAAELVPPLPVPAIPADLQAPGLAWDLADIVEVGLANNPRTRQAWNSARAASAAVSLSLGAYLPGIDAALNGTKQKSVFAGGQFIIDQTTLTPTASLSLLLFDFGGREASVRAARLALEAANWTQNAVLQNVILEIESVYYQFLAARALLEAQETSLKGAQASHDAANERHRAGVATIADVLQAKTALSTTELELVTTRGLIQTLHGALAAAMGLPASTPFDVAAGLPEEVPAGAAAGEVDRAIKEAEARRPDLAAARALALEAEAGVRRAKSTFFPSLSVDGSLGRIYYSGNPVSNPFYSISARLDLSFLFGLQQYAVLAARAQAEAARDGLAEAGRSVELQVWTSFYGLKTAEQAIATARDLVASAQASTEVARGRYKEGVGSILDLLSAQSTLENARVQLVRAKADWFLSLVQFAHDTGALAAPSAPAKTAAAPDREKGDPRP